MTDKEQAEKIALKYAREYTVSKNDSNKQDILFKESSIIECEKAALEMAAWKQEQMIYRFTIWIADLHRRYAIRNFHTRDFYTEKDMAHDIKQFLMGYTEDEIWREELLQRLQYEQMVAEKAICLNNKYMMITLEVKKQMKISNKQ